MLGVKGYQKDKVTEANIASTVGSGDLPVLSTPMMIALMEKAASQSIEPYLAKGESSVGTHIDVAHCSASPLGMDIWAESEVIAIDRRKVTFSVKAFDQNGLIGEGTHERFIVDSKKMISRFAIPNS